MARDRGRDATMLVVMYRTLLVVVRSASDVPSGASRYDGCQDDDELT